MMDRSTGRRLTRRTLYTRDKTRWVRDVNAKDAAERVTTAYVTERGRDGARWEIQRDERGLWVVWRTPLRGGAPAEVGLPTVTLTGAIVLAEREGA